MDLNYHKRHFHREFEETNPKISRKKKVKKSSVQLQQSQPTEEEYLEMRNGQITYWGVTMGSYYTAHMSSNGDLNNEALRRELLDIPAPERRRIIMESPMSTVFFDESFINAAATSERWNEIISNMTNVLGTTIQSDLTYKDTDIELFFEKTS